MSIDIRVVKLALSIALLLLIPQTTNAQSLGAREDNTALQGTNLTYYQRPDFGQCQADCANNANCQGFTWIQAGTYNPRDAAMCYLLSSVTGRSSARGHYSAVKGSGDTGLGAREDNIALQGTNLTYYQQPIFAQCHAACANNANCKGFTWIQAGTYNRNDAAMCYLLSAVTGRTSARGHFSAVKGTSAGGGGGGGGGCLTDYGIRAPRTVAAGSRIKINFGYREKPTGHTHWIGLFPVGSNGYLEWHWVKDLQGCEASFGSYSPGEYEFRYYLDGGYDKVAARTYVTIVKQ
jgi:hypothetical protein